ncbi:MAG: hypothetical protein KC457_10170, partial [Myxococcales bacterium]|nr:hypothetical protein [Myxococcales bacterium]
MSDLYRQNDRPGDILQKDWLQHLRNDFGREPWLTVYCSNDGKFGTTVFFCALIPNTMVTEVLENDSWEMTIGTGNPGCSQGWDDKGNKVVTYHRLGSSEGVEPLIFHREFHGVKEDYIEISEEFRLLHNLYHDRARNVYVKIDDAGNDEDVIMFEPDRVRVRLRHLKQYLAIRDMHLAAYFSIDRRSAKTLKELGMGEVSGHTREGSLAYRFVAMEQRFTSS